jgi:hypothetical protein
MLVSTVEINTSMILLPKIPMRKREFDARVGIFLTNMIFFEEESQNQKPKSLQMAFRAKIC